MRSGRADPAPRALPAPRRCEEKPAPPPPRAKALEQQLPEGENGVRLFCFIVILLKMYGTLLPPPFSLPARPRVVLHFSESSPHSLVQGTETLLPERNRVYSIFPTTTSNSPVFPTTANSQQLRKQNNGQKLNTPFNYTSVLQEWGVIHRNAARNCSIDALQITSWH